MKTSAMVKVAQLVSSQLCILRLGLLEDGMSETASFRCEVRSRWARNLWRHTLAVVLFGSALAWGAADAAAPLSSRLYVGNSSGDDVSIIDLATLKVIRDTKVAQHVHGLAFQQDGRRLFVTTESDNTLSVIDTSTDRVVTSIPLTGRPNQCAVTPDGRYVAVPIRDGDTVDIVDIPQGKVVKVLPIKEPHNAVNAGSNRYIFVSSMGSHAVNIIDLEKMEFSARIPVGGTPRPFVVTADGHRMYVALSDLHGFVIVDIPARKVIQRVQMPAEHQGPPRPREFEPPDTLTHGLALAADESELWVTSLLDDCIYIYDLKAKKITGRLATGDGPNWVVVSPDGKYACVSNTDSEDVSIFDVKARREVARVKVGKAPKRMAVTRVPGVDLKP
jgi:YVTN family beta-propeller protein